MSLAREALRLCTVHALRGHTIVGNHVRDSEQGPIDDRDKDEPEPTVIVYTDKCTFGTQRRDLYAGGTCDLVIEIVMTQRMKVRLEETGEEGWVWESPQTDAAMELTLGIITRQIVVALMNGDAAWSEMWRKFARDVGECDDNRGSSMRDGVRFAGRQLVIPVELQADPTPGEAIGETWTRFLALVEASEDANLKAVAPMWRSLVEGKPIDLPDWQILRASVGMTEDEARALKMAPPEGFDGDETFAAPTAESIVEVEP